jgi:ankyrin repeat protein
MAPFAKLMRATSNALIATIALLLLVGCSPGTQGVATNSGALIERVKQGDVTSVRLSIDADNSLANLKRADGTPLLYFAAANGHRDIVAYLLDRGAAVNARTEYGSALHVATQYEFEGVVEELLHRGADANLKDDWKQAPLHQTIQNKRKAVAERLIAAGAKVSVRDSMGRTPLHRCKSLAVAQLLIAKGADVNAVDNEGYTPLHWAGTPREIVNQPTIEYLLAKGADATRKDKSGLIPRQLAVKNDQQKLVAILDAHKP